VPYRARDDGRAGIPACRSDGLSCPSAAGPATGESPEPAGSIACPTPPCFIDLFCGCGGFTLGLLRAGFRCLAAIDFDPQAVANLKANLAERNHPGFAPVTHTLQRDLTRFPPEELADFLVPHSPFRAPRLVDVIVGGPSCQGFSKVRRVDGTNNGPRLVHDPRRHLYRDFLRYVDFFQPRLFVMENVLGLRSASGGEYFTAVQKEARELGRAAGQPGYRVHGQIEDAWELGVPQKRRRQLIIGVRNDLPGYFIPDLKPAPRVGRDAFHRVPISAGGRSRDGVESVPTVPGQAPSSSPRAERRGAESAASRSVGTSAPTVLWDAIGDLPTLRAGGGEHECEYDLNRRCDHVEQQGATALRYLCDVLEIDRAKQLTNHTARPHSERDLRDFALLREGESSAAAMRRGVRFEFPYDKSTFKDRYTRQSRSGPCSTIVAHLSKDGLMFIHPTQNRSLTPREAARVQTFPDWFRFPASRTQAYRLIGNAVPPLVAEAVGLAVKEFLQSSAGVSPAPCRAEPDPVCLRQDRRDARPTFPTGRHAAARELERLARLDRRALRALPTDEFLRGWHALLFLFPGLHPDNALDHGDEIEQVPTEQLGLPGFERLLDRRHTCSGWPVALELIGREAWRRYETGEIDDDEFYCVTAQRAGLEPHATREEVQVSIPTMTTEPDRFLRRLGQSIRSKRRSLHLTQARVARTARVSAAHLSGVELGKRGVSLLCLVRIAKALRTSVQSLCEAMRERTRQPRRRAAR
jgi:DNA (cytosine-5)-methyltransferase 1